METMTGAGLRVIWRRLGLRAGGALILEVALRSLFGAPFRKLPRAQSPQEKRSRAQLAPAVLVYQGLSRRRSKAEAFALSGEVVREGGRVFLRRLLRGLDLQALNAQPRAARIDALRARLSAIPNAEFTLHIDEAERLHFTVHRCHFAELCARLGLPELAPLFCAVDGYFFSEDLSEVDFERAETIAEGGACCPFILKVLSLEEEA